MYQDFLDFSMEVEAALGLMAIESSIEVEPAAVDQPWAARRVASPFPGTRCSGRVSDRRISRCCTI